MSDNKAETYEFDGKRFAPLFEAIEQLSKEKSITVAIEGRCASGKTTLSELLKKKYDANVFHMDDFFLRPEQRTEERLSKPGENIDYKRFSADVLKPLSENKTVKYIRYDCYKRELESAVTVPKKRINIVEGVYSLHPELIGFYDLKVFLEIDKVAQKERIEKRNSKEIADRFFNEWIPLEEKYFDQLKIREKADILL